MHQDEIELFSLSALAVAVAFGVSAVIGLFVGYMAGNAKVGEAIFVGFGAIAVALTLAAIFGGWLSGLISLLRRNNGG